MPSSADMAFTPRTARYFLFSMSGRPFILANNAKTACEVSVGQPGEVPVVLDFFFFNIEFVMVRVDNSKAGGC